MSDNDASIQIEVPVQEIVETPEPENQPVVTVVENGGNDAAAPLADATIDHEGRLVRIETALELILSKLEETDAKATVALEADAAIAEEVQEVREEIQEVAEEQQPDPEEDEEPAREHPFYRSRKFFGKAD